MPHGWGRVPYAYPDRRPWMSLPFPLEEYHERLGRLRAGMTREGHDCLLVVGNRADIADIRYLANFEDFYGGESVVVVPLDGAPGFATDAVMHGEPMHSGIQNCWIEDVRCAVSPRTVGGRVNVTQVYDHVADLIRERGCGEGAIGITAPMGAERLATFLREHFPGARVSVHTRLLQELRAIKSPFEIEVLRDVCRMADAALQAAMEAVRPGVTEHDLAAEATYAMYRVGAEHPAFALSVVAGARAGFKHLAPSDYRVRLGDMVYIDVGARSRGYHSDASRQRVCGEPSEAQRRFMETQIRIVEETMAAARPGVVIADLAQIAQRIAGEAGYEDELYFRGHGIGCGTHDLPSFSPSSDHELAENMVFAFEPMLVKSGFGTACWEDVWRVTATGVERMNRCQVRWW